MTAGTTVAVLYFAGLRELLASSEEQVVVAPGGLTLQELADQLVKRHPSLLPHLASVRFAVNESFADVKAWVSPGDTVALIPPVAGG